MTLTHDERIAIVCYRTEKSKETMKEVAGIISLKYWNIAVNRLYYSVYYMVSALLVKNGYIASTHAGTKNLFGLHFIKTGILDKEFLRLYSKLFDLRLKGDYDDFFDLEEKEVTALLAPAQKMISALEKIIKEQ
jgi:uncharacterized protein (UPF0332 family)